MTNNELYLPQHGLTIGFHACDRNIAEALLAEKPTLFSQFTPRIVFILLQIIKLSSFKKIL